MKDIRYAFDVFVEEKPVIKGADDKGFVFGKKTVSEELVSSEAIFQIEIDRIKINPFQPRRVFDPEALRELAASIREYGILQPLIVSKSEKETEGWFHCPVKDLEETEKQYMYPARQSRVLKYLEAKGFIKRIIKGKPPTRYIWIDYDKIIQEIN